MSQDLIIALWELFLLFSMKKIILSLFAIIILCVVAFFVWQTFLQKEIIVSEVSSNSEEVPFEGTYILYALNVHDWSHPEESAETVERVIKLHEKYQISLEVFVTDPVFQWYVQNDPELIELMKTSSMVSMSYHIRPPVPYYGDFDWLGLSEMTKKERQEQLLNYEQQALDLETGLPTQAPGGIYYVKQIIGYAPRMVGIVDRETGGQMLADIYQDVGVQFCVQHEGETGLGEQIYGLWLRPENYDLKLYEYEGKGKKVEEIFSEVQTQLIGNDPQFIGIKYHENNFYHEENPWFPVFWQNYRQKTGMFSPPFDLSKALNRFRSEEEQEAHWKLYEDSLAYLVAHPDEYRALNAVGLLEEFDWE